MRSNNDEVPGVRVAELENENSRLRRLLERAGISCLDELAAGDTGKSQTGGTMDPAAAARLAEARDVNADLRRANADLQASRSALAASESRYRLVVESAKDYAIFVTDLNGLVTGWNVGAENLLGWEEPDILGKPAQAIFTPEDRAAHVPEAEMREALGNGRAEDIRWHVKKDGSRFWANGLMMPMRGEDERVEGFLKILRDDTERKRADDASRESQAYLRLVLDSALDGFYGIDREGTTKFCNAAFLRMLGFSCEREAVGRKLHDVIHHSRSDGSRYPSTDCPVYQGAQTGKAAHVKGEVFFRQDGTRFPVEYWVRPILRDGEVDGAICTFVDLSERERVETERSRLAVIAEQSRDFIGFATLEGLPFFVNEAGRALVGLPDLEAVRATRIADYFPPEDVAFVLDTVLPAAAAGYWEGELRFRHFKTGAIIPVFYNLFTLQDETGVAIGFGTVTRDLTEQKAREAALRLTEARYRTLFEAIDVGFCLVEMIFNEAGVPVDYRFLEANLAFERQTGLGDVIGRTAREAVPDLEAHWFETYGRVATTGEAVRFENGSQALGRWFDVHALRVGEAKASRVALFFNDISDRRRMEGQLRDLNETLERHVAERTAERDRLWRLSADLLGVADAQGRWLSVNPAWEETLGWREEQIVGRTSEWLEHPDDRDRTRSEVAHLAAGGRTYAFENRFRAADGTYRWLSWSASAEEGLLYCVARDVTRDKEQAAALRLYEHIVQSDPSPVCAFDDASRVIGFNRAYRDTQMRLFGHDAAVGEGPTGHLPAERAEAVGRSMVLALSGETFSVAEAYGDAGDDGARYETTYTPLRDKAGAIVGAFSHARDVSARVRAEADLTAAQEQLRQSQKMEAVGQLTGGLAHDFNNLLTGITGSLEMLETRIGQGRYKDVGRYLDVAQAAGRRAAALTHRLLAFSRRQTLDPKPTDANRLIAGMEDLVRRTVGPVIAVEFVAAGGLWTTLVDPNQLENALLNLCINARDAMPDGGRLTIETANRRLDDRAARERDLAPGQYVSLCVSDTGTGMPPDIIAKVFEPFFTTKPLGMGTGLGLSMIYGFARQSGGQVRIYSHVGEGTTVCLYLPRHVGEAETAEALPELADAPRAREGQTVLVVDDEPSVRMLVVEVLEELGYATLEAVDGPSGLRILQSDVPLDLLVTDVGLPGGMNGRQMADAARVKRTGLKVLFITGYAENAVVGNGHLDPGMHVMTKPFAMEALATRMRDIIEGP